MTARHRHGLVVGKFSPLHRGHEFLIATARAGCERVTVLSYARPERPRCDAEARAGWLTHCVPDVDVLVLDEQRLARRLHLLGLPARSLPHDDAPAEEHRAFVAWICLELLRVRVDAVYTSEAYGDGFAAHLSRVFAADDPADTGVVHVLVDAPRQRFPVSGTEVRSAPARWRHLVDPYVHADLVPRLCVLGGESSGKTTLAQALSGALGGALVPEYGRARWEQLRRDLTPGELEHVAATQLQQEIDAAQASPPWLVCDTSPLATLVYALLDHGRPTRRLVALSRRRYDLVVVCEPEFDFVQDGTRRDAAWRSAQHALTIELLQRRGVPFLLVSGPVDERVRAAMERIR